MDGVSDSNPADRKLFEANGIYWITEAIAQGGYPDEEDCKLLRRGGITHLFNLDLPYLDGALFSRMGFSGIVWKPIVDGRPIPKDTLLDCLDALNQALAKDGTRVYIHCHAGINRSPTILALFFVACGMPLDDACALIESRSPHAIPAHPALCDAQLVDIAVHHGRKNYLPLRRLDILKP